MTNSKPHQNSKNNSSFAPMLNDFEPNFQNKSKNTYFKKSIKNNRANKDISKCNEDTALHIMENCPIWDWCNAPKCPLDPLIDKRYEEPGDPKCALSKNKRHKIWQGLSEDLKQCLPYQGYTKKEYATIQAGLKSYYGVSEEERKKKLANLKPFKRGDKNGK